ncbi:hypothetical protein SSJG_02060 [Escherichia coli D9]|nr:hypothetical protein SSJG_02060 [Escherichia coli D9]
MPLSRTIKRLAVTSTSQTDTAVAPNKRMADKVGGLQRDAVL